MRNRRWAVLAFLLGMLGVFVCSPGVEATTVERFSLQDLVRQSGRIILGRCISRTSRWNKTRTVILTTTRFAVTEDLKGQFPGVARLLTVGGTMDGITQVVSGMPVFEENEEVLLFLESGKRGGWQPLGLSQGKFRIVKDQQGVKRAIHAASGLQFKPVSSRPSSKAPVPSRIRLDDLLNRIRRLTGGDE